jgi:hypothetical protein
MTITDFLLFSFLALLLIAGSVGAIREWKGSVTIPFGSKWARGMPSALLSGWAVAATAIFSVLSRSTDGTFSYLLDIASGLSLALLVLLLGATLTTSLLGWPRALVPPSLRGLPKSGFDD